MTLMTINLYIPMKKGQGQVTSLSDYVCTSTCIYFRNIYHTKISKYNIFPDFELRGLLK